MTQQEKRIKLAEFEGWRKAPNKFGSLVILDPQGFELWEFDGRGNSYGPETDWKYVKLPDYFQDLNVVHKLEKKLSREQMYQYMLNMQNVKGLGGNNHWLNFHATAEQRCEALAITLNLW